MRPIADIEIDGIDHADAPDFADAYISHAIWADTLEPLTDDELETLNEDGSFVHEEVQKWIY